MAEDHDAVEHGKHLEFETERMLEYLQSRQESKRDLGINMKDTFMAEDGKTILAMTDEGQRVSLQMNKTAIKQTLQKFKDVTEKELPVQTFSDVLSDEERQSVYNREIAGKVLNQESGLWEVTGGGLDVDRKIRAAIVPQVDESGKVIRDGQTGEIKSSSVLSAYANVSSRYRPLDNGIVADVVRASEKTLVPIRGTVIDTDHSKFVFIPSASDRMQVGEYIPGIQVTNSESGLGAFEFFAMIYRVWCSNGCMNRIGDGAKARLIHIGSTDSSKLELPDFDNLWNRALQLAVMHDSAEVMYSTFSFKAQVLNMAKATGLTLRQIDMVIATANSHYHGGRTLADIVGSITQAAQRYARKDTKERTKFELFGGDVLEVGYHTLKPSEG